MKYKYLNYHYLKKNQKQKCFNFLENEVKNSPSKSAKNMWHNEWQEKPETLPYLLEKTDRFNKDGEFLFLEIDNKIVACSGVYKSNFCDSIYIAGVRLWVNKLYRNMLIPRNFLLKEHKRYAVENNAKIIVLTFNDHNKNLVQALKRNRLGEKNDRISSRTNDFLFHNGLNELQFPVNIQHTKQWVVYEKIDLNFSFDWKKIEFIE